MPEVISVLMNMGTKVQVPDHILRQRGSYLLVFTSTTRRSSHMCCAIDIAGPALPRLHGSHYFCLYSRGRP